MPVKCIAAWGVGLVVRGKGGQGEMNWFYSLSTKRGGDGQCLPRFHVLVHVLRLIHFLRRTGVAAYCPRATPTFRPTIPLSPGWRARCFSKLLLPLTPNSYPLFQSFLEIGDLCVAHEPTLPLRSSTSKCWLAPPSSPPQPIVHVRFCRSTHPHRRRLISAHHI